MSCPHFWCPTVRVTKSSQDHTVEVVGDTTTPQDTTDLNPFSVLPQNEEIENLAPPPGLPPEPDPTTQVATPAASTLPPQVEKIPSTDVDAILSHLYIEDSAAEPQADSTPGKPTSPEKQPPYPSQN